MTPWQRNTLKILNFSSNPCLTNDLSVFQHFVGLAFKGLMQHSQRLIEFLKPIMKVQHWFLLPKLQTKACKTNSFDITLVHFSPSLYAFSKVIQPFNFGLWTRSSLSWNGMLNLLEITTKLISKLISIVSYCIQCHLEITFSFQPNSQSFLISSNHCIFRDLTH